MNWDEFNCQIMRADEKRAKKILDAELAGDRRLTFLLRAHSRYNKLRKVREVTALRAKAVTK